MFKGHKVCLIHTWWTFYTSVVKDKRRDSNSSDPGQSKMILVWTDACDPWLRVKKHNMCMCRTIIRSLHFLVPDMCWGSCIHEVLCNDAHTHTHTHIHTHTHSYTHTHTHTHTHTAPLLGGKLQGDMTFLLLPVISCFAIKWLFCKTRDRFTLRHKTHSHTHTHTLTHSAAEGATKSSSSSL